MLIAACRPTTTGVTGSLEVSALTTRNVQAMSKRFDFLEESKVQRNFKYSVVGMVRLPQVTLRTDTPCKYREKDLTVMCEARDVPPHISQISAYINDKWTPGDLVTAPVSYHFVVEVKSTMGADEAQLQLKNVLECSFPRSDDPTLAYPLAFHYIKLVKHV